MPWYRGAEWSYLRGGLTTLDRDFGVFNKLHHNIETHVVHHLVRGRQNKNHCWGGTKKKKHLIHISF